jgi:hypothetical protein
MIDCINQLLNQKYSSVGTLTIAILPYFTCSGYTAVWVKLQKEASNSPDSGLVELLEPLA